MYINNLNKEEEKKQTKDVKPPNRLQICAKKWSRLLEPNLFLSFKGMKHENCTGTSVRKGFVYHLNDPLPFWLHKSRGKLLICPSSSASLPFILYAILMRMTRDFFPCWLFVTLKV